MDKMRTKKKMEDKDLFIVSKNVKIMLFSFLILMTLLWAIPVYSLVKDSLKVNGFDNYIYVLSNKINGVAFYVYFINSLINASLASLLLVIIYA